MHLVNGHAQMMASFASGKVAQRLAYWQMGTDSACEQEKLEARKMLDSKVPTIC